MQNKPVIGYLIKAGHCRACRRPITRYPIWRGRAIPMKKHIVLHRISSGDGEGK
jgi:hypothetical protein